MQNSLFVFKNYIMEKLNPFKLVLNRFYHFLFVERFNKTLKIDFPLGIYRWDLIQFIIDKYNFKTYLEIGCDKDQCFSKINVCEKIGVDPVSGGNIRNTSDQFFTNNQKFFDVIFLDGLHTYEQTKKDIENSLKILNDNGVILIHDCLPRRISHQAIPRYRGSWNGDVWKTIVEFRTKIDLDIFVTQIDFGVGVIKKKNNTQVLNLQLNNFKKLKFKDYYYNFNSFMRVKSYDEAKKII